MKPITCTIIRGVKKLMYMITRASRGSLNNDSLRAEVLTLLSLSRGKDFKTYDKR